MKNDLIFFTLALVCLLLVLHEIWGTKPISHFVVSIVPGTTGSVLGNLFGF